MNTSEQTTVATLAVFFALIFLLIIVTMCCILRRGCRKETTQEGNKRFRFRNADWDKSGTMTSSETRVTEAVGAVDNTGNSERVSNGLSNNTGGLSTGVLVRIEEETNAQITAKSDEESDDELPQYSLGDETENRLEAILEAEVGETVASLSGSREALCQDQKVLSKTAPKTDSHVCCDDSMKSDFEVAPCESDRLIVNVQSSLEQELQ